jgi:hypothetical protein
MKVFIVLSTRATKATRVIVMAGATRLKPKPSSKPKPILKQFTGSIAIS